MRQRWRKRGRPLLAQAAGCTKSEAHQLVDYVFDRPVGQLAQELGGTMVTLSLLSTALGLKQDLEAANELHRIWGKIEQIRAKQAAKPKVGPLPGPTVEHHSV